MIARAISFARIQSLDNHANFNNRGACFIENPAVVDTIREVVERLCLELEKDNPHFDSDRFIAACGITGNIACACGALFYGMEGKEDTCTSCLRKIMREN